MTKASVKSPSPDRQLAFHQLLVSARKTWLADALKVALSKANPNAVKRQVSIYAPSDAQQLLAEAGIRDEYVFPVPVLLEIQPTLIGYYRLLLGVPQKSFYLGNTGMGQFKSMESRGVIPKKRPDLEGFCAAMAISLAELMRQASPRIDKRTLSDLPLLALGSQFQGANNNSIGRQAAADVFLAVSELVKEHIITSNEKSLTIKNASGRKVLISLAGTTLQRRGYTMQVSMRVWRHWLVLMGNTSLQ